MPRRQRRRRAQDPPSALEGQGLDPGRGLEHQEREAPRLAGPLVQEGQRGLVRQQLRGGPAGQGAGPNAPLEAEDRHALGLERRQRRHLVAARDVVALDPGVRADGVVRIHADEGDRAGQDLVEGPSHVPRRLPVEAGKGAPGHGVPRGTSSSMRPSTARTSA